MKNEKEILQQTQEWTKEKEILEKEFSLKADKKNFYAKYKKKISTSKLLIFFLFLNCTIIELFTGWVTFKSIELSRKQRKTKPRASVSIMWNTPSGILRSRTLKSFPPIFLQ